MLHSINPFTGQLLSSIPVLEPKELEAHLTLTKRESKGWAQTDTSVRQKVLETAAQILRSEAPYYAELITLEMGKKINESFAEIEKCALAFDYYAQKGASLFEKEVTSYKPQVQKEVHFQPLGVVFGIMPWNFPFWQVVRFLAPALLVGNGVLLKHASNVPQCGIALESLLLKAGLPRGVFQYLPIHVNQIEHVIASDAVQAVTLTGSDLAGRMTAQLAGKYLKKCVLELGGSDPFVVLPDADVSLVSKKAVLSRMLNCGQSCISAKRFIVANEVLDDFLDCCKSELKSMAYGNPMSPDTDFGPLAKPDMVSSINYQITQSVGMGGNRLLLGGNILGERAEAITPSMVTLSNLKVPIWREETFGPVMAVKSFSTVEEALMLANDSIYGLGASIWGHDEKSVSFLAHQLEAGSVFVNEIVKSDVSLPFGGIKDSGYGRELAAYGLKEFTNIKTLWKA